MIMTLGERERESFFSPCPQGSSSLWSSLWSYWPASKKWSKCNCNWWCVDGSRLYTTDMLRKEKNTIPLISSIVVGRQVLIGLQFPATMCHLRMIEHGGGGQGNFFDTQGASDELGRQPKESVNNCVKNPVFFLHLFDLFRKEKHPNPPSYIKTNFVWSNTPPFLIHTSTTLLF